MIAIVLISIVLVILFGSQLYMFNKVNAGINSQIENLPIIQSMNENIKTIESNSTSLVSDYTKQFMEIDKLKLQYNNLSSDVENQKNIASTLQSIQESISNDATADTKLTDLMNAIQKYVPADELQTYIGQTKNMSAKISSFDQTLQEQSNSITVLNNSISTLFQDNKNTNDDQTQKIDNLSTQVSQLSKDVEQSKNIQSTLSTIASAVTSNAQAAPQLQDLMNQIKDYVPKDELLKYIDMTKNMNDAMIRYTASLDDLIGTITIYSGPYIPKKFVKCDGSAYPIDGDYNKLFKKIGIAFSKEVTTSANFFRVPDLRNYFVRGYDDNDTSRDFGSRQQDSIKKHRHYTLFGNNENDRNILATSTRQEFYWDTKYKNLTPASSYNFSNDFSYGNCGINIDADCALSSFDLINSDINSSGNLFNNNTSDETCPKNMTLYYIIKYM